MHIVDRQSVTQHLNEIIWRTMGYKLYDQQYTILSPAKSRMNWQPANGRVNMCSHIKAPLPPKVVRSIVWSLPLWVAAQSLNNSGESFTRQLQITFLILQQMQWKGNNGGVVPSLSMCSGAVNYILGDFLLKSSLDLNFHVSKPVDLYLNLHVLKPAGP